MLPGPIRCGISKLIASGDPRQSSPTFSSGETDGLQFTYIGQRGPDEFLFRVTDKTQPDDVVIIEERLGLTHREAEVLLWIAQGKSNRDIGDILGLSPRTVNKHLEQIFIKLGVENRTAAAVLAVRTIASVSSQ